MIELTKEKFYFVRHGRTDWNDKNLCQGQIDIPLNEKGKHEIEKLSPVLALLQFSKICTSPLLRAIETAQIIQKYYPYPIEIIDEIKERGWGILEGCTSDEMYRLEEEENNSLCSDPRIEDRASFKSRIIKGLNLALKNGTPLIVSHGRVFLTLTEILGIPPIKQISNAIIIECNPNKNKWDVKFYPIKE